jgi:hypothetical protein
MELSDVVLALVGIISAITGGVVKSLVADLKGVEITLDEFLDHPSHAEDLATKATLASEM